MKNTSASDHTEATSFGSPTSDHSQTTSNSSSTSDFNHADYFHEFDSPVELQPLPIYSYLRQPFLDELNEDLARHQLEQEQISKWQFEITDKILACTSEIQKTVSENKAIGMCFKRDLKAACYLQTKIWGEMDRVVTAGEEIRYVIELLEDELPTELVQAMMDKYHTMQLDLPRNRERGWVKQIGTLTGPHCAEGSAAEAREEWDDLDTGCLSDLADTQGSNPPRL